MKQKLTYTGAGAGIVLFALFGLLPGSFIGGVIGLNIAGLLMGTPVDPGIIQRAITALAMVAGVLTSGTMFVAAGSALGWLLGAAMDGVIGESRTLPGTEGGAKA